jgi:uncharacterized Zn finger protein
VAQSRSVENDSGKKKTAADSGWASLTWDDLTSWAGSRSVLRGRSYQRSGQVKDLKISADGGLLATVVGGDRYATTVTLNKRRKHPSLESVCSCPIGIGCKHAVAVVAEYLQALADGKNVPVATKDDPRWAKLGSDHDQDDEDEDDEDDEDEEEAPPVSKARKPRTSSRSKADVVNWDDKIEQHLRAKSRGELADLVWSLTRRFPEIYQEFRERIALQEGDVERLVVEARREIRQVTSEPAWQNEWTGEGHIPDYSKIQHRFERLLELGHADEVVSLGRDFLEQGMSQIGEAHDEGDTATAFGECLKVVFQAVIHSSLSGPERLLFAIDAGLADDYDAIDDSAQAVLNAPTSPEEWSVVADTLTRRLKPASGQEGSQTDDFSRNYKRDGLTNWIAEALENAGRAEEIRALYESEARTTGSYERVVRFLLAKKQFEDAERWAREGIAATVAKLPGIAMSLVTSLYELAQKRKQWDVVAAHAAFKFFFETPGVSAFEELMKAAGKAGVEEPVRASALRFLETGVSPYQVIVPPSPNPTVKGAKTKAKAAAPAPAPAPPVRVKTDSGWPLPLPDFVIPLVGRSGRYNKTPQPHIEVLLEMAMAAKQPDEVLRWFDKMEPGSHGSGLYRGSYSYADRVAEAVSSSYPERSIAIYTAALNAQLPHAQPSYYEAATAYLRKLRPLYTALNRQGEWNALVASIRESYRNRPRFMDLLDGLDGRTILQSSRTKRK